jgi:uncharacterized protein YegP (UPF0339 family)
MKYKIRVFFQNTNKEAISINEVYETRDIAEEAITQLKSELPDNYQYVLIPIQ